MRRQPKLSTTGTISTNSVDPTTTPPRAGGTARGKWSAFGARLSPSPNGIRTAQAALIVGLLYAAVSVYWGLGGTWLLDIIGGSLEQQGRAGDAGLKLVVWAAVALKVIAAVLPLLALRRLTSRRWNRSVWVFAWAEAATLTMYGLVYTAVGLLIQASVIDVAASANHRALFWHAYLWDPWFLMWGILVTVALLRGRDRRNPAPTHG